MFSFVHAGLMDSMNVFRGKVVPILAETKIGFCSCFLPCLSKGAIGVRLLGEKLEVGAISPQLLTFLSSLVVMG